jgi:hypothetical protein
MAYTQCTNCRAPLSTLVAQTKGLCTGCDAEETMVAAASIPNLAALVKRGKSAGLIKPQADYH